LQAGFPRACRWPVGGVAGAPADREPTPAVRKGDATWRADESFALSVAGPGARAACLPRGRRDVAHGTERPAIAGHGPSRCATREAARSLSAQGRRALTIG